MEQVKKLKVVWLCHFSNPEIRKLYPNNAKRPLYHFFRRLLGLPNKDGSSKDFAPWVTNGIIELTKRKNLELHVISPQTDLKGSSFEFELNGVHYYFYNPNWTLFLMHVIKRNSLWRKLQNSSYYTNKFVNRINPDIINLIGAENPYYSCTVLDLYILIKKYPTFQSKSIPLTNLNGTTSFITNDKYVYKTGDYN